MCTALRILPQFHHHLPNLPLRSDDNHGYRRSVQTIPINMIMIIMINMKYIRKKENEALLMYKIARIQKEDANVRNKRTLRGIKID